MVWLVGWLVGWWDGTLLLAGWRAVICVWMGAWWRSEGWGSRGRKGLVNDHRFLPVQRLCYCWVYVCLGEGCEMAKRTGFCWKACFLKQRINDYRDNLPMTLATCNYQGNFKPSTPSPTSWVRKCDTKTSTEMDHDMGVQGLWYVRKFKTFDFVAMVFGCLVLGSTKRAARKESI